MPQPKSCFAGRIIIRYDGLAGLVWDRPCPVPTEVELPTVPPIYFCFQHGETIYALLFEAFDEAGLIDWDALMPARDEFDELMERLGPLEGQ